MKHPQNQFTLRRQIRRLAVVGCVGAALIIPAAYFSSHILGERREAYARTELAEARARLEAQRESTSQGRAQRALAAQDLADKIMFFTPRADLSDTSEVLFRKLTRSEDLVIPLSEQVNYHACADYLEACLRAGIMSPSIREEKRRELFSLADSLVLRGQEYESSGNNQYTVSLYAQASDIYEALGEDLKTKEARKLELEACLYCLLHVLNNEIQSGCIGNTAQHCLERFSPERYAEHSLKIAGERATLLAGVCKKYARNLSPEISARSTIGRLRPFFETCVSDGKNLLRSVAEYAAEHICSRTGLRERAEENIIKVIRGRGELQRIHRELWEAAQLSSDYSLCMEEDIARMHLSLADSIDPIVVLPDATGGSLEISIIESALECTENLPTKERSASLAGLADILARIAYHSRSERALLRARKVYCSAGLLEKDQRTQWASEAVNAVNAGMSIPAPRW